MVVKFERQHVDVTSHTQCTQPVILPFFWQIPPILKVILVWGSENNIKMRYFDSYTLNKSKRSGIQSNGVDCKHHHVHVTDKFSFTPPPPLLFLQDSVDKHGNVNFESV